MSIIIHNIGGNPLGISEYEVCINEKRITTFKHNRPDGLTVCLGKAAAACEAQKWIELYDYTMKQLKDIPFNPRVTEQE